MPHYRDFPFELQNTSWIPFFLKNDISTSHKWSHQGQTTKYKEIETAIWLCESHTPHLYKPDVNALFSCKESLLWSALIHHCWIVHTHAQALSQSLAVDISNCFYLIPSLYLIWPQGGWSTSWHRSYWGTSDAQNTWGRLRGTVSEGLYDPARLSESPHTPVWTSAQPQQKQVG